MERWPLFPCLVAWRWMRAGTSCTWQRRTATAFAQSTSPLALCRPLLATQAALLGTSMATARQLLCLHQCLSTSRSRASSLLQRAETIEFASSPAILALPHSTAPLARQFFAPKATFVPPSPWTPPPAPLALPAPPLAQPPMPPACSALPVTTLALAQQPAASAQLACLAAPLASPRPPALASAARCPVLAAPQALPPTALCACLAASALAAAPRLCCPASPPLPALCLASARSRPATGMSARWLAGPFLALQTARAPLPPFPSSWAWPLTPQPMPTSRTAPLAASGASRPMASSPQSPAEAPAARCAALPMVLAR